MPQQIRFPWPAPERSRQRIWPVFLPFWGCRQRCIYCAQDLQTGSTRQSLQAHLESLRQELTQAWQTGKSPLQLGFFGGTFTALPWSWQLRFLDLAREFKQKGLITKIRCSTRPDRVCPELLHGLRKQGLDILELGIQSFYTPVLELSGRGYTEHQARQACAWVRASGLELGIQLMPGLPGHSPDLWLRDAAIACSQEPVQVRIYPCLVLQGTGLEELWKLGWYLPWCLDSSIAPLARALLRFWRKDITVIRIGLPQEPGLLPHIMAGPWHPALGDLVQSRALLYILLTRAFQLGPGPKQLLCPQMLQGQIWGPGKANLSRLAQAGITQSRTSFHPGRDFVLQRLAAD
ncbi:MAG: elongator complex protein 3 [Desulfohalobiaceae bacterium]